MNPHSQLVNALSRFNRKERYWLLLDAVGAPFLDLDAKFLDKLRNVLKIEIPERPWWAFDYHFDWLHAVLSFGPDYNFPDPYTPQSNAGKEIRGNQEDIDLIVAFDTTVILIEAKLTTAWTNSQMKSKIDRIVKLPREHINLYLVLSSPRSTKKLELDDWPDWTLSHQNDVPAPHHIVLNYGDAYTKALSVSRCDSEGNIKKLGTHWIIK